jgi:hypothetical protein
MSVQNEAVAKGFYDARNARDLMRSRRLSRPTRRITMGSRTIALATAAATSIAMMMMTGVAGAEVTLPYDHYICYPATDTHMQVPPPVTLIDQFDEIERTPENVLPGTTDRLCNPVFEKNGKKTLFDPVIHLKRYPFKAQSRTHTVQVINQFEEAVVTTTAAGELMVPTTKSVALPPPQPPTGGEYSFEHYKCYTLSAKPRFKPRHASIVDQFGNHRLKVIKRLWLCNPTAKIIQGHGFPIKNRERHLVCYLVKPAKERLPTVFTNNQFFPEELVLSPAKELCLPSLKTVIKSRSSRSRS